jgi:hypothetical protein
MGLTDNPFYKNMIEGDDTRILVGTLGIMASTPSGPLKVALPLVLVDYNEFPEDMENVVAQSLDGAKKINLNVKDGSYSVSIPERGTVLMFAEGETAAHTAPLFWVEYTPAPEEHQAFQQEYARTHVWLLMIITKNVLREFLVAPTGDIIHKRTSPLTDELRKALGLNT